MSNASPSVPRGPRSPPFPVRSRSPVSRCRSRTSTGREHRHVLGLAFVLTGNQSAAEDVAQDAFTAAFRHWRSVAVCDAPGAWIRRVTCNRAASVLRRRLVEAKALVRLAKRTQTSIELDEGDGAFWQAVRRLPPRQAQAVALYYFEDYSVRDIAAVLDCSEGTVKTHLSRARAVRRSSPAVWRIPNERLREREPETLPMPSGVRSLSSPSTTTKASVVRSAPRPASLSRIAVAAAVLIGAVAIGVPMLRGGTVPAGTAPRQVVAARRPARAARPLR